MKKFLAILLVAVMALGLVACGSSSSATTTETTTTTDATETTTTVAEGDIIECEPLTLTYTCSATDNTCWADMGRQMGQYLSDRTNGAITVEVYPQDQLTNGSQTEGIQAVIDGTIDMSAHSNLIYSNFDQRLNVVSLPFIFDNTDEVDEVLDGEGKEALSPIVEGLGLHLLGIAENGFRHPTNSVRPIESLEDMKGLKIRVAGAYVLNQEYAAWGANWSNANWSEVYTGLQTGTYEGQENPLPTADGASIADVQKYVTYWTGVYDCIFLTINQDVYDAQTPEVQALLDEAGAWAAAQQRQLEREGDEEVLAKWTEAGIVVSELSDEAVAEFKEASAGVPDLFVQQCVELGFDEAEVQALVDVFVK